MNSCIIKFITAPIYYPNGDPHAGHAHTGVMTDILKQRIGEPYIAFMRKVKAGDRNKKSPGK